MSNIEELDDFELAVREKLANYETTPPVGSWNAIVQNSFNENRKLRIAWFKGSSFFIVLIASMFSMWLAFGSISFELSNFDIQNSNKLHRIRTARISLFESELDVMEKNSSTAENLTNQLQTSEQERTSDYHLAERSEIHSVNGTEPNIELKYIKNEGIDAIGNAPKALNILLPALDERVFKYKSIPKLGISFMLDYNILQSTTKYENSTKSEFINNSILQQSAGIKVELSYAISKNILVHTGVNFQKFQQSNNYTNELLNTKTRIDTSIIGYIQDPFLGKIPVYKFENVEYIERVKSNGKYTNEWTGFELPVSLSCRCYKRRNLQMLLSINAAYAFYKLNSYTSFNNESNLVSTKNEIINMYTSGIAIEGNYRFNSFLSAYLKPSYTKSNYESINNGIGLSMGLKYKLY